MCSLKLIIWKPAHWTQPNWYGITLPSTASEASSAPSIQSGQPSETQSWGIHLPSHLWQQLSFLIYFSFLPGELIIANIMVSLSKVTWSEEWLSDEWAILANHSTYFKRMARNSQDSHSFNPSWPGCCAAFVVSSLCGYQVASLFAFISWSTALDNI